MVCICNHALTVQSLAGNDNWQQNESRFLSFYLHLQLAPPTELPTRAVACPLSFVWQSSPLCGHFLRQRGRPWCTWEDSGLRMVYLSSWEEFSRAAEQLYSEHPSKVGFHRMRLPVICSDGFMALVSRTWCVKRRVVTIYLWCQDLLGGSLGAAIKLLLLCYEINSWVSASKETVMSPAVVLFWTYWSY